MIIGQTLIIYSLIIFNKLSLRSIGWLSLVRNGDPLLLPPLCLPSDALEATLAADKQRKEDDNLVAKGGKSSSNDISQSTFGRSPGQVWLCLSLSISLE